MFKKLLQPYGKAPAKESSIGKKGIGKVNRKTSLFFWYTILFQCDSGLFLLHNTM